MILIRIYYILRTTKMVGINTAFIRSDHVPVGLGEVTATSTPSSIEPKS